MNEHSPLPWKRGTDGLIFDANNEYVTDTCGTSLPEGEENQKLIVRAVNCHDALAAALKALIEWEASEGSGAHIAENPTAEKADQYMQIMGRAVAAVTLAEEPPQGGG